MTNFATIGPDGIVTNVVVWDGTSPWEHDDNLVDLTDHPHAGIGWTYQDGTFVDNRPDPDEQP